MAGFERITTYFKDFMSETTFGKDKLTHGIKWLESLMDHLESLGKECYNRLNLTEKIDVVGRCICNSYIDDGCVITSYHQMKNILDIFESTRA